MTDENGVRKGKIVKIMIGGDEEGGGVGSGKWEEGVKEKSLLFRFKFKNFLNGI